LEHAIDVKRVEKRIIACIREEVISIVSAYAPQVGFLRTLTETFIE